MILRNLLIKIGYDVNSSGLVNANRQISNLKTNARGIENQIGTAQSNILGMMSKIVVGFALFKGARFLTDTINEFQQLEAQLTTLIGNEAEASQVFDQLKENAVKMPFELKNITAAYVQMSAVGLKPSMDDMNALGDISAGMGKDISQMGVAVKAASSGITKPLKQFGITAKQSGDQMTLSFRGQSLTVKKNATEIKDALVKLGKSNFAGGMERQMKTIGGAWSNMLDNMAKFANQVGEAGLAKELNLLVRAFTGVAGEGENVAEILGKVLGFSVRQLTDLVLWAKKHSQSLIIVLGAMGAAATFAGILKMVRVFHGLAKAEDAAAAASRRLALRLFLFVAVAILLAGAIEDVQAFGEGKDSIIGRFLGPNTSDNLTTAKTILIGLAIVVGVVTALLLGMALVPALIAGLFIGAIAAIASSWDDFGEFFRLIAMELTQSWRDMSSNASEMWDDISEKGKEMWNDLSQFITDHIDELKEEFQFLEDAFNLGGKVFKDGVGPGSVGKNLAGLLFGPNSESPDGDIKTLVDKTNNNRSIEVKPQVQVNVTAESNSPEDIAAASSKGTSDGIKKGVRFATGNLRGAFE